MIENRNDLLKSNQKVLNKISLFTVKTFVLSSQDFGKVLLKYIN